jgi:hypothetical protein
MKRFVIEQHEGRSGPFTEEEVRRLVSEGALQPNATVVDTVTNRRLPASALVGIARSGHAKPGEAPALPSTPTARAPRLPSQRGGETGRRAAAPPPRISRGSISDAIGPGIDDTRPPPPVSIVPPPPPAETLQADAGAQNQEASSTARPAGTTTGNPWLLWGVIGGAVAALLVVGLLVGIFLVGGSAAWADPHVRTVQMGRLEGCPHRTVGEMTKGFMTNPRWKSIVATDGLRYVNCRGGIIYSGRQAVAEIQFQVIGTSFSLRSLEIDGQPQSLLTRAALIRNMCEQ